MSITIRVTTTVIMTIYDNDDKKRRRPTMTTTKMTKMDEDDDEDDFYDADAYANLILMKLVRLLIQMVRRLSKCKQLDDCDENDDDKNENVDDEIGDNNASNLRVRKIVTIVKKKKNDHLKRCYSYDICLFLNIHLDFSFKKQNKTQDKILAPAINKLLYIHSFKSIHFI